MPRARKDYPGYPSHTQLNPGAYAYSRGRGREYPNHHNYNNYGPPKFYGNQNRSMPRGQEYRYDGGWNSHQHYNHFNYYETNQRQDWGPRRNEHTYRASYFPNPILKTMYPSRGFQLSNTKNCNESQIKLTNRKTDLQPLLKITPESQSTLNISKLDIPPMADSKLNIKSEQTTESCINFEIRRVDLQPNIDIKMLKSDPIKNIDMTNTKLQLASKTTESQVNFEVQVNVEITAPKSPDKMNITPAGSPHKSENKMAGRLIKSENRPQLDYIDLTADDCETIKQATKSQPSFDANILMTTSNLHLQLPSSHSTEEQNEKPLLTTNAVIVQVAARGHNLEYTRNSADDYSPPPAESPVAHKKVSSPKKSVQKKTAIEDIDMRIGQIKMPIEDKYLQKCEKSSTIDASSEKSSRSCLEIDIPIGKKTVTLIAKSKVKDPQLCSTMLASISSAFACKSKDSKIGDKIPSPKESGESVDAPPGSHAAAAVFQEETICKEITAQKNEDIENKTLPAASSVAKSKHAGIPIRKTSSDTEKPREMQPKKANSANEKRRTSSSSIPDVAESVRHRCSSLPVKEILGKNKESSGKGLNNTSGGTKLGTVVKGDGIDSTMDKSSLVASHFSSRKTRSNAPSPNDGLSDKPPLSSESLNTHSSKDYSDKNKAPLVDGLVPREKLPKDSRDNSEKSKKRKHRSSRKSSSDSEKAGDKSSSSSTEKCEKQKKSYQKSISVKAPSKIDQVFGIENDSNQELVQKSLSNCEKDLLKRKATDDKLRQQQKKLKTTTMQPDLDPSTINCKRVHEKTKHALKRSEPLTIDDKSKSSKKRSCSETRRNRAPEDKITKPAGKSKKRPGEAIYKMTLAEWKMRGKPNVDTFKETNKQSMPLLLTPDVPSLSVVPDEKIPLKDAIAVELEKSVEQLDVCHNHIPDSAEPVSSDALESRTYNTTDLSTRNKEDFDNENEETDKSTIVRFEGNMINISEAHLPVITIRDSEKMLKTASTGSILTSTESSGFDLINIPNYDVNMFSLKEEKELIIDDSDFPPGFIVKEEINVNSNSKCDCFSKEEVVEIKPHIVTPFASTGLLRPLQAPGSHEFPGKIELTKLVEYFILLNQDLIKYNDSYRIASRLDETLRRVDERRATSDLLLVIKKVKPLIEELVNLTKVILKPGGDLPELIYNYKEILPSDALKLKADTLSRKAIADIFRLISEGNMDDMGFYQSSTVIVYNKEQGLNNINLQSNIKPESMSQSYQSVIRNF